MFVSLVLSVFLVLFEVCFQSAQDAFRRSQTQSALELAEMSVLSEYHRKLLKRYDLFYLDLGYGTSTEDTTYLKRRIQYFLDENLSAGETKAVEVWDFSRATDDCGMAFYEQAVSVMKQKTGVSILEDFQAFQELGQFADEKEEDYEAADAREAANLEELKRRREEEEQLGTSDPTGQTKNLKGMSVLNLVLEEPAKLSSKLAEQNGPSVCTCLAGKGARGKYGKDVANDAFFLAYLQEYLTAATDFLAEEKESQPWLDYQLEYVIAGKESDIENLESICARLLAIREGINYAYLLTDAAKVAECGTLAATLVGATMIPGLVEAMKQVLLLTWAFAESVLDVRALLAGKRVAFWKDGSTWKLSLSGALELEQGGADSGLSDDAKGLSYRDYLGILLTLSSREKKALRSLDVIEGVIRGTPGGQGFYVDQCVDSFYVRAVIYNGKEWSAQRMFRYEW